MTFASEAERDFWIKAFLVAFEGCCSKGYMDYEPKRSHDASLEADAALEELQARMPED